MNYKVLASIQNLGETVGGYSYDFITSEESLNKTGQLREVPSEHTGSQESIEAYLVASELTEIDNGVLAIIVIADEE